VLRTPSRKRRSCPSPVVCPGTAIRGEVLRTPCVSCFCVGFSWARKLRCADTVVLLGSWHGGARILWCADTVGWARILWCADTVGWARMSGAVIPEASCFVDCSTVTKL
jgi:hypothetical protein